MKLNFGIGDGMLQAKWGPQYLPLSQMLESELAALVDVIVEASTYGSCYTKFCR